MSNLIMPVNWRDIVELIGLLNKHLSIANEVSSGSTPEQINKANNHLWMARGLFQALWRMKALANWQEVEEDMNRIEGKLTDIRKGVSISAGTNI